MHVSLRATPKQGFSDELIRAWGVVWGVLQDYYATTLFPGTSLSVISLAGGLQNFVCDLLHQPLWHDTDLDA